MNYTMKMPASYVDVSKKEMEYEEGGNPAFFLASLACDAIGMFLVPWLYSNHYIDANTANALSVAFGVAGTVLGIASGAILLKGISKLAVSNLNKACSSVAKQLGGDWLGIAGWGHTCCNFVSA